jgi:hypothetical protein
MAPLRFPKGSAVWCANQTDWGYGKFSKTEPADPYSEHNESVWAEREAFQAEIRREELRAERAWARSKLTEELSWLKDARGSHSAEYKEVVAQIRALDNEARRK